MKTTHKVFRFLTGCSFVISLACLPIFFPSDAPALDAKDKIAIDLELANKADLGHAHKGGDITSGKIAEAYIDEAITRDSELAAAIEKLKGQAPAASKPADTQPAAGEDASKLLKRIQELEETVARLSGLLQGVSRSGGNIVMSGVNLQIVNGSGKTDGPVNGLGNLIVGYNESPERGEASRKGSHNVVVGSQHNYSSYGGLAVGISNTISGPYASVSGGYGNMASGPYASVSGGHLNKATAKYTSVSGGLTRTSAQDHNWCGGEMKSAQ